MSQIPVSLKIPSKTYNNIAYSVYINSMAPEAGTLDYALLRNNVNVSCSISVKESLLDDHEFAIITLAYKQVKSKSKRYKSVLASPDASNVLYRQNLDGLIKTYKTVMDESDYSQGKALLLNSLTSSVDSKIGDTGLQCMFRFQRFDGSSQFILSPGGPLRNLSTIVGLSVFEASSVEEVLDIIILEMANLISEEVLPKSGLEVTPDLQDDIIRYLRFSFYGE